MTRQLTLAGFALLLAAGVAFEVYTRSHPGLPTLVHALTRRRAVRAAAFLFWAYVGWHLFVRGSGAFD